jgi:hypothetical protein
MEGYTQPGLIAASVILRPGSGADPHLFPLSVSSASCASFASLHFTLPANHFISIHLGDKAPDFVTIFNSQQKNKLKRSQLIENKQPSSLQIATKLVVSGAEPTRPFKTAETTQVRGA